MSAANGDAAGSLPETLAELTTRAAARWPERTGLIFDATGERLSFAEIERRTNAVANALTGLGIGAGDTVGVMLRNVAAFPITWLALQKAGATMVPLNVFYKRDDAAYLLEHSEAKAVVTAEEFVPLMAEIAAGGGPAPLLVSVDGDGGGRAQALEALATADSPPTVAPDRDRLAQPVLDCDRPQDLRLRRHRRGRHDADRPALLLHGPAMERRLRAYRRLPAGRARPLSPDELLGEGPRP
ncbi:MAG: AMP-binding protein [Alphaproteobacteria bacterium]